MKIKTVSGEVKEVRDITTLTEDNSTYEKYVLWSDIKTIIAEYQDKLDYYQESFNSEHFGIGDYGLMGNAMLEDED